MIASVPFIDYGCVNTSESEKILKHACEQLGFFGIYNVPYFPPERLQECLDLAEAFFALDVAEKEHMKAGKNEAHGFFGMGSESLEGLTSHKFTANTTRIELKEFWQMGRGSGSLGEGDSAAVSLFDGRSNKWPTKSFSGFSSFMKQYHEDCLSLALSLLDVLEKVITPSSVNKNLLRQICTKPVTTLRLLHYWPLPSHADLESAYTSIGAHRDYGLFTLLLQDSTGGLQVFKEGNCNEWIDCPPSPSPPTGFIVNIGNMLMKLSAGNFKSAIHRVVNKSDIGRGRYSVPFFLEPNLDTVIDPSFFNRFGDEGEKEENVSETCEDILMAYYRASGVIGYKAI